MCERNRNIYEKISHNEDFMTSTCFILGIENYDNQMKYGKKTFDELEEIHRNGFTFEGIHHDIDLVSCCDWKAAACIEGLLTISLGYAYCRLSETIDIGH